MLTILRSLLLDTKVKLRSSSVNLNYSRDYSNFGNKFGSKLGSAFEMSKTALVVLANGTEEMEAVITTDILRRSGMTVTVAGLGGDMLVKCSNDVLIKPDCALECTKCNKYDAVILPGGVESASAMGQSALVGEILKKHLDDGRIVAAMCAAPMVLLDHCLATGTGRCLTSYPSFKTELEKHYDYIDNIKVVRDGNLITSRGPGTTFEFALEIVEVLVSLERRHEVAKGMLM